LQQVFFALEIIVECGFGQSGLSGDVNNGGLLVALLGKKPFGGIDNAVAGVLPGIVF